MPSLSNSPWHPRCTPTWVGLRHLPNEFTDVRSNCWAAASVAAAFPAPVQPEAFSVPTDDGFGFDDGEHFRPVSANPGEQDPEESVAVFQMRTFDRTLQDSNLLPQCEILESQMPVVASMEIRVLSSVGNMRLSWIGLGVIATF